MSFSPVAVIPVYNQPHRVGEVVAALRAHGLPVILVDDGSDARTAAIVSALAADRIIVERLPENRGKGAAVMTGLACARARGFTHALQVDADGQHDLDSVPALLDEARRHPGTLVSGRPVYDASIPKSRLYGRHISHFFARLETLSRGLDDAMCGFRVYPVAESLAVANEETVGARMDFDTEIMVRLHWRGVISRFVPVRVTYPEDGISHFDVFADNWRITKMHARLCAGMLWRSPRILKARFRRGKNNDSAWARQSERGSLLGMRFLAMVARLAGHAPVRLLLHPVTLYFFLVNARARRASRQYLERVHARAPAGLAAATRPNARNIYRHFHSFANAIFEKLAAWQAPDRLQPVTVHGGEILAEHAGENRGMLFFSAHLGNLEMCRALARLDPALKVNALVYTRNAKKFSALMSEANPEFRERLVLVEDIGADTAVHLRTLLDRGEIVVMVADRTPASENGRVVSADFLGDPAPFATGPYVLAHLLECPAGLLFCMANDAGHYEIFIERFADRIQLPRGNRQAALEQHAARFAARLEHHVLQRPLQWFNFHNFWAASADRASLPARRLTADG